MPDWPKGAELGPRQMARPLMWVSSWPGELPEVSAQDMLTIHGDASRGHRVLTYGHGGNVRDGSVPHFISTRAGYKMHTDDGFVRFTHQVVLRNEGFAVVGLDGELPGEPQTRGTMYCLDTWSPHEVVDDDRIATGAALYKLQAAVDAPEPLSPAEVVERLSALLSDPRAHIERLNA